MHLLHVQATDNATNISKPDMLCAGSKYGPPGSRHLVYFVDDMNMPLVDKYDTQTAIELMRQHIDQKGWFDKVTASVCTPMSHAKISRIISCLITELLCCRRSVMLERNMISVFQPAK